MLKGKKIMIGVSGSIAAYKVILLTRLLIKEGAEVKIIMTPAAQDFVSALTLSTLSKNPVVSEMFVSGNWSNHVMNGRWADLFVIAPLSCNTLSKMATGLCDNMLMATYLSATCPIIAAPAMDEDMWHHPTVKRNLELVRKDGVAILNVGNGELASGLTGDGRMAEPNEILENIRHFFNLKKELSGKRFLVSAGPTYEAMDPVRFIGNHSSGKMGIAICEALVQRGAEVDLVLGPTSEGVENGLMTVHNVVTSDQMYAKCHDLFPNVDAAIMAAAVADFKPDIVADEKIKKVSGENEYVLRLVKTRDILKSLGKIKSDNQFLIGFALETHNESENALKKLKEKNLDLIVLNSLNDKGAGFGHTTNKISIINKIGVEEKFDLKPKSAVANDIVERIVKLYYV